MSERPLRVDIRVPVGLPVPEMAEYILGCEGAGFDGVGVHDHQHSGRDVYVTLALAGQRTSTMDLYPVTSNPVTRHPMVLAALANTLQEIAPGRVKLTVGPGFLAVRSIGRPRASVDAMREAVLGIRRLLQGEELEFGERRTRVRNLSETPVPVFMTAAGPRMVELAGEVADGVLLMVGIHPKAVEAARGLLERGAARAGRDLTGFPVVYITSMAVSEDPREARSWPQRWLGPDLPWLAYPSRANFHWLREAGIEIGDDVLPEQVGDELAGRVCAAMGLFGTAEECGEQLLRARQEAGVERVFIFPCHTVQSGYDMPTPEVEAFRDVIFPMMGRTR